MKKLRNREIVIIAKTSQLSGSGVWIDTHREGCLLQDPYKKLLPGHLSDDSQLFPTLVEFQHVSLFFQADHVLQHLALLPLAPNLYTYPGAETYWVSLTIFSCCFLQLGYKYKCFLHLSFVCLCYCLCSELLVKGHWDSIQIALALKLKAFLCSYRNFSV